MLTLIGSEDLMDERMDFIVCKKVSNDGFFFGLTSANSSVICRHLEMLIAVWELCIPVALLDSTGTAIQLPSNSVVLQMLAVYTS